MFLFYDVEYSCEQRKIFGVQKYYRIEVFPYKKL